VNATDCTKCNVTFGYLKENDCVFDCGLDLYEDDGPPRLCQDCPSEVNTKNNNQS
jgi:hypothetical protein